MQSTPKNPPNYRSSSMEVRLLTLHNKTIQSLTIDTKRSQSLKPHQKQKLEVKNAPQIVLNDITPPAPTKIRLGICCREKKLGSRPMRKILEWLSHYSEFEICKMNDEMLLNKPIEQWLRCDVLISFYSDGFPLQKAINYVEKYKPKMINDLFMQAVLWDRPSVLERLKKRGIAVAKSFVVLRGEDKKRDQKTIQERQDMIES